MSLALDMPLRYPNISNELVNVSCGMCWLIYKIVVVVVFV